MRKVITLIFSAVAFAAALFGDDAAELKTLQDELSQVQAAEQSFDVAAKEDNPADAMLKLIRDESLAGLYEKWAGEKWTVFASAIEKEISTANRRYKIPEATPGAAEEMLAILEPNLKELKKKYLAMSKGDPGWADLTRQMVEQKKKVDKFKKQAEEEKTAEKEKIDNAVSVRQEVFLKISEKVKDKLQSGVGQPLEKKIGAIKKRILSKIAVEKEREMAAIRKAEAEEAARREEERKELEPKYRDRKAWYDYQLSYYGMREQYFKFDAGSWGPAIYIVFTDRSLNVVNIQAYLDEQESWNMTYSACFAEGFARELLLARTVIYKFENPNWEEEYEKELMEKQKRKKRLEKEKAQSSVGEQEKSKRSSYKSYVAPKRKTNPDLKRFKRNDRFAQ